MTGMPAELADRIDEQHWRDIISGLNAVFERSEAPSLGSLLKTVILVPLLFGQPGNVFREVQEYIEKANLGLKRHGVRIVHPGEHQYVELEVEIGPH